MLSLRSVGKKTNTVLVSAQQRVIRLAPYSNIGESLHPPQLSPKKISQLISNAFNHSCETRISEIYLS